MPGKRYEIQSRKDYRWRGRAKAPSPELLEIANRVGARVRPDLTAEQRGKAAVVIAASIHPAALTLRHRDLLKTRLDVARVVRGVGKSVSRQSRFSH